MVAQIAPSSAAQSRIVFVSELRKRRGGGFAENAASAPDDIVIPRLRAQLERERGVVVLGEQSEEDSAGEHEWR